MGVYARRDIDIYAEPYCLTMGCSVSPAEWLRRKLEYLGEVMQPAVPIVDYGRDALPFQLRMITWRSPAYVA